MVSSRGPTFVALREEVLARGPPSQVSLVALDMAAVLPLRKASTIRNLRTDCSSEEELLSAAVVPGRAGVGVGPDGWFVTGWRDILAALPLAGGCWEERTADAAVVGPEARPDVDWESSEAASSSFLSLSLRPRRSDSAADDLDRLC